MRKALKIVVPVALAFAALAGGLLWQDARRAQKRAREKAAADDLARAQAERTERTRAAACWRVGLSREPGSAYVALPSILPYNDRRSSLGRSLFADRRLASTRWRMCCMCHSPENGWTDQKTHAGLLTRPFQNAVLATLLLHDGSATNLTDAVRVMIEDGRFCAGGPLSNVVMRLAKDSQMVETFRACYDNGLTEANILDAINQFARTQLSNARAFDRWCDGRGNALDEAQKAGQAVFDRACTACHDGPVLGALRKHEGKRVPGLRGLPQRGVFLANGSCTNLESVLELMPGGELSTGERAQLLAFLKTL